MVYSGLEIYNGWLERVFGGQDEEELEFAALEYRIRETVRSK